MFRSAQLYEIYRHPSLSEEDATVLVRQGFSVWAFLFHIGWLLYHRLWLEGALFAAIYVGVIAVASTYGMGELAIGVLQIALQFWLAVSASDMEGAALERRGYVLNDVSSGESALEAERRYYYTHEAFS